MSTFAITEWQSLCLKFGLYVNCISSYITSISNKTYLVSLLSEEVNSPIIFQLPFISLTWTGWKHSPFVLAIAQSLSSCATEHICSLHFLFLQPFHFWFGGQILLSVSVILSEWQNWAQISQNKIYRQHTSLNVVRKYKQWCVQHGKLRITYESWPLGLHRRTSSYVLLLPWIVWKAKWWYEQHAPSTAWKTTAPPHALCAHAAVEV